MHGWHPFVGLMSIRRLSPRISWETQATDDGPTPAECQANVSDVGTAFSRRWCGQRCRRVEETLESRLAVTKVYLDRLDHGVCTAPGHVMASARVIYCLSLLIWNKYLFYGERLAPHEINILCMQFIFVSFIFSVFDDIKANCFKSFHLCFRLLNMILKPSLYCKC